MRYTNEHQSGQDGDRTMLSEKLNQLPPEVQREALDFIEFLSQKYATTDTKVPLEFPWAGALSDLKNQFTSVELQHRASDWR